MSCENIGLLDNDMIGEKGRTAQPAERGTGMGQTSPMGLLQGLTDTDEDKDVGLSAPPGIVFGVKAQ
jgi:hypothetical protein